jgi:hypothetical protein
MNSNIINKYKLKSKFAVLASSAMLLASPLFTSCENADDDFANFDYSTVYFSRQYPIRTVVLGNDEEADNTLDNNHQIQIWATIGGMRSNGGKTVVDIAVDNSLCNNLYFKDDKAVKPMPEAYYKLLDNKIVMNGNLEAGVTIQLTDAFFADADAVNETYVIPVRMTGVSGADSILSGTPAPLVASPIRQNSADWAVLPKDYILYCVKFINPWSGNYLRRGVDVTNGVTTARHKAHVENDQVFTVTTSGYRTVNFPYSNDVNLKLTFAEDGTCTVVSATAGVTATGTGKFVEKSEKKAWGNKDRDAIYLDYSVTVNGVTTATKDTLVARDRNYKVINTFSPVYK